MEKVTIDDILKRYGLRLGDLADQMGVHISLLSRIKTDKYPITKETQRRFQKIYKDNELVNGVIHWKAMYEEKVAENNGLKLEIGRLRKKIRNLKRNKIKLIELLSEEW